MTTQTLSRQKAKENAEDIFFGQIAIIWARWFLVAAGILVSIWSNITPVQFTISILVVVALMTMNFFMHGRYMVGKPANEFLLIVANALDVAVITLLVLFGSKSTGIDSYFFVLYYPLLFAFALVFSPMRSILFTLMTLLAYVLACVFSSGSQIVFSLAGFELLAMRVITIGAMGGLGAFYYRRQRDILRANQKAISAF
jgi:hypothetical protein